MHRAICPKKIRSERGVSTIEASLLIASVMVALLAVAPLFYRSIQGGIFWKGVQSLDRQFDPYDHAEEHYHNESRSTTDRVSGSSMMQAATFPVEVPATFVDGMQMGLVNLPSGFLPRESAGDAYVSTSSKGGSKASFHYEDQITGIAGAPIQ